jgi:hypothetical protein
VSDFLLHSWTQRFCISVLLKHLTIAYRCVYLCYRVQDLVMCHSVYRKKMKPKGVNIKNQIPEKITDTWWNAKIGLVLRTHFFALQGRRVMKGTVSIVLGIRFQPHCSWHACLSNVGSPATHSLESEYDSRLLCVEMNAFFHLAMAFWKWAKSVVV